MRIPLKYSIRAVRVLVFTRPRPKADVSYEGGASFADVLRTEVDFLHRHVETAAQKLS